MTTSTLRTASGALALSALLVGPILASPADAYGAACCRAPGWLFAMNYGDQPRMQSSWHINMHDRDGMLVSISPVAAKIRFGDGSKRVFAISHGSYERMRSYVGDFISFDVRHDVLHMSS
jgi:hypothetical protein